MQKSLLAGLLVCAGACCAMGAPRESVTFIDVPSVTNMGSAANTTLTHTFTGGYQARRLLVQATLATPRGATWQNEASILVTPPGSATPFVVAPFVGQTFTGTTSAPAGSFAVPVAPLSAAGEWSFQFFEMFDDASAATGTFTDARDATWTNLNITLDDEGAPAIVASGPSVTFNDISSDGTGGAGSQQRTWSAAATETFAGIRVRGRVTALRGLPGGTAQITNGQTRQAAIRITPPGGTPIVVRPPNDSPSTVNVDQFISIPGAGAGAGEYAFEFFEFDGTAANLGGDQSGGPDNFWSTVNFELSNVPPPATDDDLGTLQAGPGGAPSLVTRTYPTSTRVLWVKLTTTSDANDTTGYWVDIDSNGSVGAAGSTTLVDVELGLYRANGTLRAEDDDSGWGTNSLLTFGDTDPARDVVPFPPGSSTEDARNGSNGELPAGTYYLAVVRYNTSFGVPFAPSVITTPTTHTINVRTNLPAGPAGCGPSDVAGQGQTIGADGTLSADDIIVFINWFFAADTRADIAGQGQTVGADGQFSADDIILFINRFFAGC